MTNAEITVLGLVLDIIGVCLLWKFGLPPNVDRGGPVYMIAEQHDEKEKKKAELYDRVSYVSLALIVLGFLLQAVGSGALQNAASQKSVVSQTPAHQNLPATGAAPAQAPKP